MMYILLYEKPDPKQVRVGAPGLQPRDNLFFMRKSWNFGHQ